MASYLVTGGAGFIGSHLAEELLRRGQTVRIADSLITGKRRNLEHLKGAEFIEGDLADMGVATRAFKRLDADVTVSEDELVGLKWTYFNALQHSDRPARTLHKALSRQPKIFIELLSAVFTSKDDADDGPPDDPAAFETARAVAIQAFRVLEEWKRVPGSDERCVIDGAVLEAWVKEARRLSAEVGRAEVGDSRIGRILSAAARIPGEAWPPEPVRDIIEMCRSRDLEEGFQIGLYNRRGVTVRLPTDGGQLERELATQYRADALACAFTWQRTQAVLERIAEGYERDAAREDQGAEQWDWT